MKSIEAIENKFESGNSIPCEFARVYLAEWEAIVAEVAKLEADVLSARADGRGEVLAEFLADDPDADWFGEFIIDGGQDESGEHSCYWDEPALLQKFRATDRAWSAIREADDSRIDYLMKCDQAEDELSQLRAKVAAFEANDRRYKWLRTRVGVDQYGPYLSVANGRVSPDGTDAAIDAAMGASNV